MEGSLREIIKEVSCYRVIGKVGVRQQGGVRDSMPRPTLPILYDAWVAYGPAPDARIAVKVLLDTGNDVTIIDPKAIQRLEEEIRSKIEAGEIEDSVPAMIPAERSFQYYHNTTTYQPAFDLTLFLNDEDKYTSDFGFISPEGWPFEGVEVWLGQDIFRKLVVTFDGRGQTVTIADPEKA
jgi:hypothetical protein